jgi:hypothetical protein
MCVVFLMGMGAFVDASGRSKPRLTKKQVIAIGLATIRAEYPEYVAAVKDRLGAKFDDGVWTVGATNRKGEFIGGPPIVAIHDLDRQVVAVYLAR